MTDLMSQLRDCINQALGGQRLKQAAITRRLGCTPKHLCAAKNGRSDMSTQFVDRVMDLLGYEITVTIKKKGAE